ncbi:MAG: hypothetical protein NZ551_10500 [Microscillaceae bacterium]|nr:hypothetical protein [Microscillaceae bacterium]MDW8461628.1 hypothetical protein [Cytophagales bacterium]
MKEIFTTYWHFLALRNACQYHLFDLIEQHQPTHKELHCVLT